MRFQVFNSKPEKSLPFTSTLFAFQNFSHPTRNSLMKSIYGVFSLLSLILTMVTPNPFSVCLPPLFILKKFILFVLAIPPFIIKSVPRQNARLVSSVNSFFIFTFALLTAIIGCVFVFRNKYVDDGFFFRFALTT
jgi:hypothetical protein